MLFPKTGRADSALESLISTDLEAPESLSEKLYFLQLTSKDLQNLRKLEKLMDEHAEKITKRHYDMLATITSLRNLIEQHSTWERLHSTFVEYLKSIPRVETDEHYVRMRMRIGVVHSRTGLDPEWFIGSFTRIYEYLTPAILRQFGREEGAAVLLSLNRILTLDSLIVMEAYQQAHEFKFIETNSRIIEELIEMDKIQPLLDAVNLAIDEATNVTAAAEQLTSSIQEVAEQAVYVAEKTDDLIGTASNGQQVINESLHGFLAMVREVSETKKRFDELFSAIENVTKVVGMIREIADQTQLLALNAAIEAARAGEEGRGFAVVSGEIRKLSEQTKESAGHIAALIDQVRANAGEVVDQSNSMVEQIERRVNQAKEATVSLEQIIRQVNEIGQATGNIAAIVQEQSAATHDISSRINEVLKQTESIQQHAVATGQDIYQISVNVNELRLQSLQLSNHLGDKEVLRTVKTDHLLWRWWIYNSLLGFHQMASAGVSDHRQCRLGKWYESKKNNPKFTALPSYQSLEEPHRQFHLLAHEAMQHLEEGRRQQAQQTLGVIEQASQEVVRQLEQLRAEL